MRVVRSVVRLLLVLLVLLVVLALAAWWQIGRSRAQLTGEVTVAGLGADVTIDRDALGVPTVRAASRDDLARALGFLHAQERFFQMDLARRRAAGELSELFGRAALPTDRSARLHRFRARASRVLEEETEQNRAVIAAYTAGVNSGLEALAAAPFEYQLLRQTPRPWVAEDSVLVVASMFFSLQDASGTAEARAGALAQVLPAALVDFLNSTASEWDSPELGATLAAPVPPGPDVFDLQTAAAVRGGGATSPAFARPTGTFDMSVDSEADADARGSNNWAVAGSRTKDGRAIVANDMHLGLGVPNIWYRASLVRPHYGRELTVTGATLPGVPSVIVGSNGSIAWGFTNTTADWTDRVVLDVQGEGDSATYMTPAGQQPFAVHTEVILTGGGTFETLIVRDTIWGPVDGPDAQGRLHAVAWVAHSPRGMNFQLSAMDEATTIEEAMEVANRSGTPGQNCVIADSRGGIGWTIAGRIPKRVGFDGRVPTSWADGTRGWHGWYEPHEYPRILNPASGIIVTANNRIVSDGHLAMLGDGGYDPGARARQIRTGLLAADKVDYETIRRVHLDDRAILMERWRDLALSALRTDERAHRDEFKRLVETTWTGRASIDSTAYRLVRQFRLKAAELAWAPYVNRVRAVAPGFPAAPGRALEGPVWALLTTQPAHLLDPKYPNWNALMLDAIDQTIAALTSDGRVLAERTWGEANTLTATHPISRAVPLLSRWLDLPRDQLPGDSHVPRFQSATNGASERMAVSPGHESAGYFHMPGGQSGHPRSANYKDGHAAWVNGDATPFLPGPSVARLVLKR